MQFLPANLFKTTPKSHQLTYLNEYAQREYFAILSEPGTGKTWMIINNAARLWAEGKINGLLVFAPNGVHLNWTIVEIPAHMPEWVRCQYAAYVAGGKKKDKLAMKALMDVKDSSVLRILAVNTESMQHKSGVKIVEDFCNSVTKLMVVVDEAEDFKNPSATRTKELMKLKKFSSYRRIMDGTLGSNGPFDVFAPMNFLNENILGTTSFYAFKAEYAEMLPKEHGLLKHIIGKKTAMSSADRIMLEQELGQLHSMVCANGRQELMLSMDCVRLAADAENYEGVVVHIDEMRSMLSPAPSPKKTAVLKLMAFVDARVGSHLRLVASANNPNRLPQIVERDKEGKPKYRNLDKLHALIAPHSYRVRKKDCLDLPEKVQQPLWFDMTEEQWRIYEKARDDNRLALDGLDTPFNKLAAQTKLMQITSGYYIHPDQPEPVRIPGANPKLDLLVQRANTLKERGKKVIIWARFRIQIEDICKALRAEKMKVVEYHGGISASRRVEVVQEFQTGSADVIVAQQQAGGKGITLVAASDVFYFSNDYSLRNKIQSEDRAHRIGQTEEVTYTNFCARDTVDVECVERLDFKKKVAEVIMGDAPSDHKSEG